MTDSAAREGAALRIVHVVETLKSGGAEAVVRELCKRLPAHGLDVAIVSIYADRLDAGERLALGVPVVTIGRRGRADVTFFPKLVDALRRLRPDVVHCHLHAGKYAGRAAALLAGVPRLVFTEHGDDRRDPLRFAINRVLHGRTERFIAFTESQRSAFARDERIALERIEVIPNGVSAPSVRTRASIRASLGLRDGEFATYMAARLSPEKNHALALEALALGVRAGRPWRLVLAGSGPSQDDVVAAARRLGIADRVLFLGHRTDAAELAQAMDALLLPSRRERMPLALGEAMLTGLPVVSTPWDGVADFIEDGSTGFVSRAFSARSFYAALARAADEPRLRAAVAARARELARARFDLDGSVRRHAELYRRVAGRCA